MWRVDQKLSLTPPPQLKKCSVIPKPRRSNVYSSAVYAPNSSHKCMNGSMGIIKVNAIVF